ncbi:lipoprotein [Vallitalea longa]|uniref:Lipoprotein n=1 Tax=Vallitalea longa TaxID=2936439 RepID=A0A9W5Y7F7_9FIRM|nr:CapA family protein [Vallitalea longa]GKX28180.1 lipoprotein [Vallitalea longa]
MIKKKRVMKILVLLVSILTINIAFAGCDKYTSVKDELQNKQLNTNKNNSNNINSEKNIADKEEPAKILEDTKEDNSNIITITAIGDCTLGSFPEVTEGKSFEDVLQANNNDYGYPFKNAYNWTKSDDLTLINFEGTLTDATELANKKWRFKGPKEYTNFLTASSIEVVNIANNHSFDYLEEGYNDTVKNMNNADIGVSGNEYICTKNINGTKIAFIGHEVIYEPQDIYDKLKHEISTAREEGADIIVCSFHWGIEYNNMPTPYQQKLGHYAIDTGADLVIGHHPHILQGIELYNGKYIAYSLGNFVFGGNEILYDKKHKDVDTILLRHEINLQDKKISDIQLSIVPFRLSGDKEYNNYQPIVLNGEEGIRIKDKLINLSKDLKYGIKSLEIEN